MGSGSKPFAALCFIVTFLDLIPLTWHFRTKNVAIISLGLWLAQGCFFLGIDALLWQDNIDIKAEVYCDISEMSPDCLVPDG